MARLSLWAGCAAQADLAGARRTPRGTGGEVDGRPTERSCLVAGNFLEQIRKAQKAAMTKPETGAPKPAEEMTDANLGAEVKPTPSSEPAA